MNTILKKLKDTTSDCSVTIILNTHRTHPDNEKDVIVLKNLIKEAENRLYSECGPSSAREIQKKLQALAGTINHAENLESLVLFVNEDIAEYTRLPIHVVDRVVIDKTFATRDLIRSLHKEKEYYVLVLNRDKARLIEAFNDKVVQETEGNFPFENDSLYPKQRAEASIGSRQTNLVQEFFNLVDKLLLVTIKENPLPVLIATDESNYHEFLGVADRKEIFIGHLSGNRMEEKAHHIIEVAWPIVQQVRREKNSQRLQELAAAANTGQLLVDFSDMWRAVNQGKGATLFVRQGYFQPARVTNDTVELVSGEQSDRFNVIDDIIDEMIEINLQYGGDSVFLSAAELEKYQGLVLTTRY